MMEYGIREGYVHQRRKPQIYNKVEAGLEFPISGSHTKISS